MRGVVAKKLRKIAASLNLTAQATYVPGGPQRYRRDGTGIPRPRVLVACFRRAYLEAKKVYKGEPMTALCPEIEQAKSFDTANVDSMRAYKAQE